MSTETTRRDLLTGTLRGAAVTMTAASYSRVMGANAKIRYGIIGAGDRGQHDMDMFTTNADVEVAAAEGFCDDGAPDGKAGLRWPPLHAASSTAALRRPSVHPGRA